MNWEELGNMMTDGIAPQGRQITLFTGISGAEHIAHALAIENSVGYVEWMEEKKQIEPEIAENLITMLRSRDLDNFNLAILAIEHLKT
jgi:hypothetical protein